MKRAFIALIAVGVILTAANVETVRLDKLDRATEVYIQRGLNDRDAQCYVYALKYIKKNAKPTEIYVTFDDPMESGVSFGVGESGEAYSCVNGRFESRDEGTRELIRKFP
ncbi:hypothetical protein [Phyllobacterium sp. SB3]|uniref:hypothetical protein n=1 Tax=Phyllobacterium sp. SB3 TaxID=3156073 RepID=UPI0032AF2130